MTLAAELVGRGSRKQDETPAAPRPGVFGEEDLVAVSSRSYGISSGIPVHTAASYSPARTLIGNGSSMYGAQLPGR
jgi:hypothetical protein